jgi:hypothetical protein
MFILFFQVRVSLGFRRSDPLRIDSTVDSALYQILYQVFIN